VAARTALLLALLALLLALLIALPAAAQEEPSEGGTQDPIDNAMTGNDPETPAAGQDPAGQTPAEGVEPQEGQLPTGGTVPPELADPAEGGATTPTEGAATTPEGGSTTAPTTGATEPPATGDPLTQAAIKAFQGILGWIWGAIFGELETMTDRLDRSIFVLPDVTGQVGDWYEEAFDYARPFLLTGLLALGIMMMLNTSNYNVAYLTQNGLPRLAVVAASLSFFPLVIKTIQDVTVEVSNGLFPGDRFDGVMQALTAAATGENAGQGLIVSIGSIVLLFLGLGVEIVGFLVDALFVILFASGPFALMLYAIPNLKSFASTWLRLILACASLPVVYSLLLKVGSWAAEAPEALLGAAGESQLATLAVAIGLFFGMCVTPFWFLNWALASVGGASGLGTRVLTMIALKKVT